MIGQLQSGFEEPGLRVEQRPASHKRKALIVLPKLFLLLSGFLVFCQASEC